MGPKPLWTKEEICAATQGGSTGYNWNIQGLSIDSRTTQEGDLYIPIRGETVDGHDFLQEAFKKGASAALIDHLPSSISLEKKLYNLVEVQDTGKALWSLGIAARQRSKARIVAITGSVGKTTTKAMLAHILSQQAVIGFSEKSFNTKIGVPVSLASMPREAKYGVFEIGMNMPGEIAPLSRLVAPDVALITMIAPGHIEYLKTLEGIADEKVSIIAGLSSDGVLILNRDMPLYEYIRSKVSHRVLTYGKHPEADLHLVSLHAGEGRGEHITAKFKEDAASFAYAIPVAGEHMAINSLGALLVARELGADVLQGANGFKTFEAAERRGRHETLSLPNGGSFYLIDESYNANPTSVKAALEVLASLKQRFSMKRSIAVLGDMKELGEKTAEYHRSLVEDIKRLNIDHVFTCGTLMKELQEALPEGCSVYHAPSSEELIFPLVEFLQDQDIVMVKGSLSMKMGFVVGALKEKKETNLIRKF